MFYIWISQTEPSGKIVSTQERFAVCVCRNKFGEVGFVGASNVDFCIANGGTCPKGAIPVNGEHMITPWGIATGTGCGCIKVGFFNSLT